MRFKILNERLLWRGEQEEDEMHGYKHYGWPFFGKFFYAEKPDGEEVLYGRVKTYELDDSAKIFEYSNSREYIYNNDFLLSDKEVEDIKSMISQSYDDNLIEECNEILVDGCNASDILEYIDMYDLADEYDQDLWCAIPQYLAYNSLSKSGYSGAHWLDEEFVDEYTNQFQIWDLKSIKKI